MKKKNIIICIVAAIALWCVVPYLGVRFSHTPDVREGDVIFHCSRSKQSPLIAIATGSPLTHCGIIVMRDGKPYVLEASSTLRVTPLAEFIDRGRLGAYWLKRSDRLDADTRISYSHLLGRSYDLAFSFDNDKYYCSELVYDIYKRQLGIELCEPRPINSYFTLGMKKKMLERGMDPDGLAVAPVDLFRSSEL